MSSTLLVVVVALLAPLLTYLTAIRRLSGKIKTSDAAQLWAESRSIREDLTKRNDYLRKVVDAHSAKLDRCEQAIRDLTDKNDKLLRENTALQRLVDSLRARVSELEATNGT